MLLGYAMDSNAGDWQGVLPYDESSGLAAELAGQLADMLMQLSQWRQQLSESRSLSEWLPLCRQLLDTFFEPDNDTEAVLVLIEQQWQKVISYGIAAQYPDIVPLNLLRDELASRLDNERISQRFLAGPINFCTLMPMRSIPFKVVCLLGMNDGVYPRTLPPLGFDLMAKQVRRGDRSRRDDDRYLFLEALLSAQQQLYISYIGRSIQDNSKRYPSVLVSELIEYISQSYHLPVMKNSVLMIVPSGSFNIYSAGMRVCRLQQRILPKIVSYKAMPLNGYLLLSPEARRTQNLISLCRQNPYLKSLLMN